MQLHGDEPPAFCKKTQERAKVIKAFGVGEQFDFSVLKEYENCCSYFLFDTKTNEYGGSGKKFNPEILEKYKGETPFFLSGGIDSVNTGNLTPFAIDVNSRFEVEPGLKDINKLKILKDELSGKQ